MSQKTATVVQISEGPIHKVDGCMVWRLLTRVVVSTSSKMSAAYRYFDMSIVARDIVSNTMSVKVFGFVAGRGRIATKNFNFHLTTLFRSLHPTTWPIFFVAIVVREGN